MLSHHGILGQKWHKRNGPPYPLGADDHSASEKKAGWIQSLRKKRRFDKENKKASSGKRDDKYRKSHVIEKGTVIYRTTDSREERLDGPKYVTYLDVDRNHYRTGYIRQKGKTGENYEHQFKLKEDLKVPGRDELKSVVVDQVKNNPQLVEKTARRWFDMVYKKGTWDRLEKLDSLMMNYEMDKYSEKKIIDEYVKRTVKSFGDKTPEEAYFYTFQSLGTNKELMNKISGELKKRGYNAMVDEAGVGGQIAINGYAPFVKEGIDPIIVFDGNVLEPVETHKITNAEEEVARKKDEKNLGKFSRYSGAWSAF